MRGEEVILLNFPISHFLKSLAHSAMMMVVVEKVKVFLRFNFVVAALASIFIEVLFAPTALWAKLLRKWEIGKFNKSTSSPLIF